MKYVLPFLLILSLATDARAQRPALATFIEDYARTHELNGTMLVAHHGDKLYQQSFGSTNFQLSVANTNTTKLKITSIIKLFTTVLVMQLYDEERLALEAPISTDLMARILDDPASESSS